MTSSYSGKPCFKCGEIVTEEFPWLVRTGPELSDIGPICDPCYYKYYAPKEAKKRKG